MRAAVPLCRDRNRYVSAPKTLESTKAGAIRQLGARDATLMALRRQVLQASSVPCCPRTPRPTPKDRMSIDWFPGHMLAARKEVTKTVGKVDVVIEILDARVPGASCNPQVESLRTKVGRPALKVLNKADLADPHRTRAWLDHYNALPGVKAVAISCKKPGEVVRIPDYCVPLAPNRGTVLKPLRMMILGIPNVGKSTLMNALLKRAVVKAGNEPGLTKHQTRHELNPRMTLIDTPGLLWPQMDPGVALKLAASHSIGRNAYADEEVAVHLGAYLLADYPALLTQRYGAPLADCDGHGLIAWVAQRRGLLIKGGEPDLERAAGALLDDYRTGALGRITLETPPPV